MNLGETEQHDPTECPSCGYKIDAISSTSGKQSPPEPGNISICVECLTILIIEEVGRYREATTREIFDFDPKLGEQIALVRRTLARIKREAKIENEKNFRRPIQGGFEGHEG